MSGAVTSYIDVAQLTLYAFWIFFAGLILYLRREDKREGYPLESDHGVGGTQGFPALPEPKTFRLANGGTVSKPDGSSDKRPIAAMPSASWPGAPLEPTGDPMRDAVGPASYAARQDTPDLALDGKPKIVPMRVASDFHVESRDPDPRGMSVFGADGAVAGSIRDIWVDRSEVLIRYLEVTVPLKDGSRNVLLPMNFARVQTTGVTVKSITAAQFAHVPGTTHADQVTFLEEDKIMGYYGGGTLYALPDRMGPIL
jgi:photosynthetic reaction center H subunit